MVSYWKCDIRVIKFLFCCSVIHFCKTMIMNLRSMFIFNCLIKTKDILASQQVGILFCSIRSLSFALILILTKYFKYSLVFKILQMRLFRITKVFHAVLELRGTKEFQRVLQSKCKDSVLFSWITTCFCKYSSFFCWDVKHLDNSLCFRIFSSGFSFEISSTF